MEDSFCGGKMSRRQAKKEKENSKASSIEVVEDVWCNSISGQYSEERMITQLKGIALDPCNPQFARDKIQPLWNHILSFRKFRVLIDSEMCWKKRKLERFLKDKLRASAGFVSPSQQNIAKRSRRQLSQVSSMSCFLNSVDSAQSCDKKIIFESHTSSSLVTFDKALPEIQITTDCSYADDVVDLNCPSKDVHQVVDSAKSVNSSNLSSPEDSTSNEARHLGISDAVYNSNSNGHLEPSRRSIRSLNFIGDHIQRKDIPVGTHFQYGIPEWDSIVDTSILINAYNTGSDHSKLLNSHKSANGSNSSSPYDSISKEARHLGNIDAVHNSNSNGPHRRHLEPSCRSIRLPNYLGDHLQRKAIPVGPRFQADIPEWDCRVDKSILINAYNSDSDCSKLLGSRVWPVEIGNIKNTGKRIGEGRHHSCSCVSRFRGSADCIKCHILEERLLLQRNLGPAFSSWKFDEMGEQVSEPWSLKERQTFESLMKKRPSSDEKSYWKRALKCLPSKSKKDIVCYYFNVYIPHRMSLHRPPSRKQVDTDDEEEVQNFDHMRLQKRAKGSSPIISNKKGKYLRSS